MRSYYEILRVSPTAGTDEIRRAYRRLARLFHPDASPVEDGGARFRELREAYETLSDLGLRRQYDRNLAAESRSAGRPSHREWFADEIAVDFPSVSALAERIRDRFLNQEERPLWLTAELLLLEDEAYYGVVVPLEVPVRCTCPVCGGRGETWMELCSGCLGTGEAVLPHRVRLAVPPGVSNGARFRFSVESPYAPPTRVEVRVAIRVPSPR
jgi:molecular chaperone DnaJ